MKAIDSVLRTQIAARVFFYFGAFGLMLGALSVNIPDWKLVGATPLGFLKAADTCFLMSLAVMLSHLVESTKKSA
jgi:hypothetical protein